MVRCKKCENEVNKLYKFCPYCSEQIVRTVEDRINDIEQKIEKLFTLINNNHTVEKKKVSKHMKHAWTEEEDKILLQCMKGGLLSSEIAKKINTHSKGSVINRVYMYLHEIWTNKGYSDNMVEQFKKRKILYYLNQ